MTAEGASFQEHGGPYTWTIVQTKPLDIEHNTFYFRQGPLTTLHSLPRPQEFAKRPSPEEGYTPARLCSVRLIISSCTSGLRLTK